MMSSSEIVDCVERLMEARTALDRAQLTFLIHDLLRGPRGDALNVSLILAGLVADTDGDHEVPEQGFHSMGVVRVLESGEEVPGDVDALPGHVAAFARMVTALLNNDRDMARDLWMGYIGDDDDSSQRALHLLIFALEEAVHTWSGCPCQQSGAER